MELRLIIILLLMGGGSEQRIVGTVHIAARFKFKDPLILSIVHSTREILPFPRVGNQATRTVQPIHQRLHSFQLDPYVCATLLEIVNELIATK